MTPKIQQLLESFPELLTLGRGNAAQEVCELQAASLAKPESLIFVGNAEHLREALESPANTWVVSKALESSVPAHVPNVLRSSNVQLAMALIGKKFFPQTRHHRMMSESIHPRAVISPSARLGKDCIVGPGAVIGDDAEIGDGCIIGSNTVIEVGVKIGARSHIHPLVFIGHDCVIGQDCEVKPHTTIGGEGFGYAQDQAFNHHRITHYGRVVIEDRVHVGANVQIDRGTFHDSRIGEGTKIDNHSHFGHNIVIGKNTLIVAGMLAAGSTTVGSHCVFGGRLTVKGHLKIGDGVQLAGLTAIGKDLLEPGSYGGFPVQDLPSEMRVRATLKNLPQIAKQVKRILKHLGLTSEED